MEHKFKFEFPKLLDYSETWKADLGLVVGSNNFKSLTEHLRELHREQIFHFEPDYEDYSSEPWFGCAEVCSMRKYDIPAGSL
jgi:hypothetical protein